MTNHPRFERVHGSVHHSHWRYHCDRLAHAVLYFMACANFRRGGFRRVPYNISGNHIRSAAVGASQPETLGLKRGLLRLLIAILASPQGEHGGWEGGARGL